VIDAGVVTCARVTHDSASVDDLAVASPDSQRIGVAELLSRPEVEEALVISTCNRVEAYVVTPDRAVGEVVLAEFFADVDSDAVVIDGHDGSLRHLLAVAAGLESVVLGEDQIIGQVRDAYEDARTAGGIGSMLEIAVTKALHVGERARTETGINEGVVSLGSAAAKLVAETVGVEGSTALVVGAGEMGELAAKSLADHGAGEVIVANRTRATAREIVSDLEVSGKAVTLEDLEAVTDRSAVVVAATGSKEPLLGPGELGDRRQTVVDLGQPRDVDPDVADLPDVILYDMDDLEAVTRRTRKQRAKAAADVEEMIDREYELLCEQYKRTRADAVIAAMYESAERIKSRELETAISRLEANGDLSEEQVAVVRSMADALVNQLLAPPTKSLREAAVEDDWQTINTALCLFDPDFGPEFPSAITEPGGGEDVVGTLEDD